MSARCGKPRFGEFSQIEVRIFEIQHKEQLAPLEEGRIHPAIVPAMNEPRENRFQSHFLNCPMVAILPPKLEWPHRQRCSDALPTSP